MEASLFIEYKVLNMFVCPNLNSAHLQCNLVCKRETCKRDNIVIATEIS